MLKSTEEINKIFGSDKESLANMMEGYVYLRWPSQYIYHLRKLAAVFNPEFEVDIRYPDETAGPEIDEMAQMAAERMLPNLLSTETSTFHGKVMRFDETKALLTIDEDISVSLMESVIPYKHARDILLKNPDQIAVIDCPCRLSKENPCEPVDVCMIVGDPFASFVLEHKTNNARKISQDEAVSIVQAEDDRGHIHSAWFRETAGDRFYGICNCCKCCCSAMRAHHLNIPMLASSGYVGEINEDCNGCGLCVDYCQFEAISINGEKATVNYEKCMGCGVCETKCPVDAISLKKDPAKGEPLDIRLLHIELGH